MRESGREQERKSKHKREREREREEEIDRCDTFPFSEKQWKENVCNILCP